MPATDSLRSISSEQAEARVEEWGERNSILTSGCRALCVKISVTLVTCTIKYVKASIFDCKSTRPKGTTEDSASIIMCDGN